MSPLVILAAGHGRRMAGLNSRFSKTESQYGCSKGLLDFRGQPWFVQQLRAYRKGGGGAAMLVVGDAIDEYQHYIDEFQISSLELVLNKTPELGAWSSVRQALERNSQSFWLLPVDVPAEPGFWTHVQNLHFNGLWIPNFNGRGGHPIHIGNVAREHLLKSSKNQTLEQGNLREEIRKLDPNIVRRDELKFPNIRANLNRPEDWSAYLLSTRLDAIQ